MTDMWGDLVWAALADLKTRLIIVRVVSTGPSIALIEM